ncbi:MAG: Rpn family recombination-promoting nuclease/putative transposase, partial [Bacteroidia bacterium]|nr:Rpn family recombination-promoting nuclease/putative transposase [Bacteroidia bacterium]
FYRKLRPVIFIGILDFVHTENKNYLSRSQIRDVETGEQTIRDMEFNFIELPKFRLELDELETLTEKWIYFIKNAENLEVVPENINDEGLKSAYEEANVQTWTQEELDAYEYAFMREEDERARLDKAKQEGKEEGKEEEKEEIVIEMYADGLPVERIAKILKISVEKVLQIIENHVGK